MLNQCIQEAHFDGGLAPGSPALDGPLQAVQAGVSEPTWLLDLCCDGFVLLLFTDPRVNSAFRLNSTQMTEEIDALRRQGWSIKGLEIALTTIGVPGQYLDVEGYLAQRYQAQAGTLYLLRPDQYVLTRWKQYPGGQLASVFTAMGESDGQSI